MLHTWILYTCLFVTNISLMLLSSRVSHLESLLP